MLYANCFLTAGAEESIIQDVHRQRYLPVKKRISALLQNDFAQDPIEVVRKRYPDWVTGIDAYLHFLVEHDYGFYTDEPHKFKPIDRTYRHPALLSYAIVEVKSAAIQTYASVLQQLLALGCQYVQLLFSADTGPFEEVAKLLQCFEQSRAHVVDLYFEENVFDLSQYQQLSEDLRIRSTVFGMDEARSFFQDEESKDNNPGQEFLYHVTRKLDARQAEQYRPELFNLMLLPFLEAQQYNVGLHQKVAIDRDGNIKNYLNHEQVFGNVSTDQLAAVIASPEFQQQWNIGNDRIEKCQDCQYRYMCFSHSFIAEEGDIYRKVETCRFNPYANAWD